MAYKGNRGVELIDKGTRTLTETGDGADRLTRWLVIGFALLILSLAGIGLWFAAVGGTFGHHVAFLAMFLALLVSGTFQRRFYLSPDRDERETLVLWKASGTSTLLVAAGFAGWALVNGYVPSIFKWVPSDPLEWRALAFAAIAAVLAFTSIGIALLTPPYLAENDDEL